MRCDGLLSCARRKQRRGKQRPTVHPFLDIWPEWRFAAVCQPRRAGREVRSGNVHCVSPRQQIRGKVSRRRDGNADLRAHFLPFDIGNFEFHSPGWPALTKEAQQEAIYQLNQNVLKTNANQAEMALINGWYCKDHTQRDEDFHPSNDADYYAKVIARNCRTCHIAQRDQDSIKDLNFSSSGVNGQTDKIGAADRTKWLKELVCGQTDDLVRAFAMPNSKVTFDLFWLSRRCEGCS
jgi:hypothetical protein